MIQTCKTFLRQFKLLNFLLLAAAGLINAFGITMFLSPVKLYDSGISGTSMLLAQLTPAAFTLSIFLLVLNVPLFLYGCKKQGLVFTIYALYTVAFYSLGAYLIIEVLPVDVSLVSPLAGSDLLLCSIFGGAISGIGSGMAIRFGGAMDGVEVMAVIFAKRLGITVGSFVMIYNVILYIIAGIVTRSWVLPLYSIITYGVGLKTIDFIVEGFDRAKSATIVTTEPEAVAAALSENFGAAPTAIPAFGGYSQQPKTVLYFVVNRFQIGRLKTLVHLHDPNAYITMTEVADIYSANM